MKSNKLLLLSFVFTALVLSATLLSRPTKADVVEDNDDDIDTVDYNLKEAKIPLKTDDQIKEREERAMSHDGYSVEEQKLMKQQAEKFEFQAEVARLMGIIINSLYTNKEIFLRELLSNGSDALDKIRFLSLTNPSVLGEGDSSSLDIRIKVNPEAGTIDIIDKGIGMTKDELVKNLGTIAQSGTTEFLEKYMKGEDKSLIGKFGVGFYSAFLVADVVTVTSKSNDDPDQWVWQSQAGGSFTITKDPKGNTLGRGTKITLLLNDASSQYLDPHTIKELATKYSEYINFPIYLWTSHEEEHEVLVDETDETEEEIDEEVEEELPIGEQEVKEKKQKTKIVSETVWGWERLNDNRPLWLRPASEITKEEYNDFYKALTKMDDEPIAYSHFSIEGEANFKALLYVPRTPPSGLWDPNPKAHQQSIKLYVRRVYITGDFYEIMPPYLRFMRGVVDSDDISLNVSREQIQESHLLDVIKKKLVRKSIAIFQDMFKNERDKYEEFYNQYKTNIKVGVIEDQTHRDRLSRLLLFYSSKSDGKYVSFEEYVSRMKEGQKEIYLIVGESLETVSKSPLIERLVKNDYEVIYMTDPIDEYLTNKMFGGIDKFDKYKLVNIGRDGVKLDLVDSEKEKALKEEVTELVEFLQKELEKDVEKVVVSTKLTSSPAVLVSTSYGITANLERIMKSQALAGGASSMASNWAANKRIMEINPGHPVIKEMNTRMKTDKDDTSLKASVQLLYRSALLNSGYSIEDPTEFAKLLNGLMARELNIDPNAQAEAVPLERDTTAKPAEDHGEVEEELHVEL